MLPFLPVDDCRDFELKEDLRPIEVSLTLTPSQIRELISGCSNKAIIEQFEDYIDLDRMTWIDIDSSCINAVAYNSFNSVLQIRFNSDSVYQYSDVPADVFDSLLRSVSKGLYFNSFIKDVYDFQLVDN